ncbi:hypothetical protein Vafri_3876 [Volvox africanus]|uniref:Uncharacterized protein n=1 Tax=Volvox africanus TaxID=51714 RepID=A0A8J4EWU8_9CHLO|nr:hypothetical protein Vafri_3876 [Volvox africanus]
MAVGGCPEAGDPVAVAVRVAMCAREMVMATAGFRSSAGQQVQIRLGLHSVELSEGERGRAPRRWVRGQTGLLSFTPAACWSRRPEIGGGSAVGVKPGGGHSGCGCLWLRMRGISGDREERRKLKVVVLYALVDGSLRNNRVRCWSQQVDVWNRKNLSPDSPSFNLP